MSGSAQAGKAGGALRRGLSCLGIGLLPLLPLALYFGFYAVMQTAEQRRLAQPGASTANSSVKTGTPLAWRKVPLTLPAAPQHHVDFYSVVPGDFDGDGDQELAVVDFLSNDLLFFELDGSLLAALNLAGQPGHSHTTPCLAWDYDRDGSDELIADDASGNLAVYSTTGQLARLNYSLPLLGQLRSTASPRFVGDADGDGWPELWLRGGNGGSELHALGKRGALAVNAGIFTPGMSSLVCDMDQDGLSELAWLGFGGDVILVGAGSSRTLGQIPQGLPLSAALDINGDGLPDLLCGTDGYLDGDGQYSAFGSSAAHGSGVNSLALASVNSLALFDLDGNGLPELLSCGYISSSGLLGMFGTSSTVLRGFDARQQTVVYEEHFRNYPTGPVVARSGGTEYLIFLTSGYDLLVYP